MATRAVTTATALLLAACSLFPIPDVALPIADLDAEPREGELIDPEHGPRPAGPIVVVASGTASGERFTLTAFESADGPCLSLERENSSGTSCGAMPGEGRGVEFGAFGVISLGGGHGVPFEVTGLVAPEAEEVWLETTAGRASTLLLGLAEARIQARAFLVFLPHDVEPLALVAVDEAGREIGRRVISDGR